MPALSSKQIENLGLPPGIKFYTPFPFAGMNQNASPFAMDDKELFWQENFIKIGPALMRALAQCWHADLHQSQSL